MAPNIMFTFATLSALSSWCHRKRPDCRGIWFSGVVPPCMFDQLNPGQRHGR